MMGHALDALCDTFLRDGMHIHVASTMARPNALLLAVARTGARRGHRYTISSNAFHAHMHALADAGVVSEAITCFAGDTYPTPRPSRRYRGLPWGKPFPMQEWSLFSLLQRLHAGATGQRSVLTSSLTGSDLAERLKHRSLAWEGEGGQLRIPALRPDITLMHASAGDAEGNLYLTGPLGESVWGALASRQGVLATVEHLIADPADSMVRVPTQHVLASVQTEGGAHPQGLSAVLGVDGPAYPDDYEHLRTLDTQLQVTESGVLPELVRDPAIHARRRTRHLKTASILPPAVRRRRGCLEQPTPRQVHTILAARAIASVVRERDYQRLFAGIGLSHLATWLAAMVLADEGRTVSVDNEMGMLGLRPGSGDPFLFGQANVSRCDAAAGTWEVFQAHGPGRGTLAVLSAGEIDPTGALNSSRDHAGGFLVGSGGANDFGSRGDTLVVAQLHPRRFVSNVGFVTTPGTHVLDVATQFGHLSRDSPEDRFTPRTWWSQGSIDPSEILKDVPGWGMTRNGAEEEPPLTQREIHHLLTIDAGGTYA